MLKWGGGHSKKKEKKKKRQQFAAVSVKRDLLCGKRDLVYGQRDVLYGKRDLLTPAHLRRVARATASSKTETLRSSRPWGLAKGRPQEAEEEARVGSRNLVSLGALVSDLTASFRIPPPRFRVRAAVAVCQMWRSWRVSSVVFIQLYWYLLAGRG